MHGVQYAWSGEEAENEVVRPASSLPMKSAGSARDQVHMSPSDPLSRYSAKRNFARTPEPRGVRARKAKTLAFVIQKHWASRLHYDFRLELDGVLLSWAVPKGAKRRSAGKAHGDPRRGPPGFLRQLSRHDPAQAVRCRNRHRLGPWHLGTGRRSARGPGQGQAALQAARREAGRACGNWCVSPSQATSRNPGFSTRSATPGRGRWPSTT